MLKTEREGQATSFYEGEAGRRYFARQNKGGLERGKIEARTKFARYIKSNDAVLDFGCGSGALLASLKCAYRIGIDINPAAREVAMSYGVEVHETPNTVQDGSIDIVISNHALEHVACPFQILSDMHRKLALDGRIVICVPLSDWRVEKRINSNDPNRHLYSWTPLTLANLLDEAGFSDLTVRVFTHAWIPYWYILHERLPTQFFDGLCYLRSVIQKRRQLIAVAKRRA